MEYIRELHKQTTPEKRKFDAERFKLLRPKVIPVIIDRSTATDPVLTKHKYLIPIEMTVLQFINTIRTKLGTLPPSSALFMYNIDNVIMSSNSLVRDAPTSADGFIYFLYAAESTFG